MLDAPSTKHATAMILVTLAALAACTSSDAASSDPPSNNRSPASPRSMGTASARQEADCPSGAAPEAPVAPPPSNAALDPYALTTCKIPGVSHDVPPVPAEIEVPPGLTLLGGYRGIGTQFFECSQATLPDGSVDPAASPAWRIRLDRIAAATFYGDECTIVGTLDFLAGIQRGARNTWTDGSQWFGRRVFELLPEGAAPGIPWLLLSKSGGSDTGFLSQVTYMQRLETIGGLPPGGPCDPAEYPDAAIIPFEATYYLYTGPAGDAGATDAGL